VQVDLVRLLEGGGQQFAMVRPTGVRRNARQRTTRRLSGSLGDAAWVLMPPVVIARLSAVSPSRPAARAVSSQWVGKPPPMLTAAS